MATASVSSVRPPSIVESGIDRPLPLSLVDDALSGAAPSESPSPKAAGPPPNPPFVFPARPTSASAPSSFSRATGRRSRSTVEAQEQGFGDGVEGRGGIPPVPPLPAFVFNPGSKLSPPVESPFLSPPLSPQSPRAIPIKPGPHGHRRGGSEFVGGSLRAGDTITVLSASPTKSESGFASPGLAPVDRSDRKSHMGHRHRRSAAMSNNDLSKILQPASSNLNRGSSAPTSPSTDEVMDNFKFPMVVQDNSTSAAASTSELMTTTVLDDPVGPTREPSPPQSPPTEQARPLARARVGFSDTLEFIPRPLSLVSSDTSSTATARPSHSLSGSVSSIISLTSSTTADRNLTSSPINRHFPLGSSDMRPTTAGAVLERIRAEEHASEGASSPRRRNSIPVLASLPSPTLSEPPRRSPTKTPKRWSFFGLEPFINGSASPARSPPLSATSSEPATNPSAAMSSAADNSSISTLETMEGTQKEEKPLPRTRSKKQKKKVRIWSGSILTRKSKQRHMKRHPSSRRAPTPPSRRHSRNYEDLNLDDHLTASSSTSTPMVIETPASPRQGSLEQTEPKLPSAADDDSSYPMIDLDAALGPFNTPLPKNPEWEAAQRASGLAKRTLHSAAGAPRFSSPGMYYQHRRAESAPEMVPFEAGRFGIPRFNSNSTMADVFEEDEENDEAIDDSRSTSTTPHAEMTPDIEAVSVHSSLAHGSSTPRSMEEDKSSAYFSGYRGRGSAGDDDSVGQSRIGLRAEPPGSALQEDVIMEEPHEFVPPVRLYSSGSDTGALQPSPSPRQMPVSKELAPVDIVSFHLPTPSLAPTSPYSMAHSSSFPSPRSPMSYDANRVSTAPSSVAEDNLQSLLMGEPGPELRMSVDDVPSLSSSHSTMTRESNFRPQSRPNASLFGDQQRPASVTSAAFGRRRSSLASLSRLISTSYGERSKLSMEISVDGDVGRKPKVSRTKRLSRLVQFWKPKEEVDA